MLAGFDAWPLSHWAGLTGSRWSPAPAFILSGSFVSPPSQNEVTANLVSGEQALSRAYRYDI